MLKPRKMKASSLVGTRGALTQRTVGHRTAPFDSPRAHPMVTHCGQHAMMTVIGVAAPGSGVLRSSREALTAEFGRSHGMRAKPAHTSVRAGRLRQPPSTQVSSDIAPPAGRRGWVGGSDRPCFAPERFLTSPGTLSSLTYTSGSKVLEVVVGEGVRPGGSQVALTIAYQHCHACPRSMTIGTMGHQPHGCWSPSLMPHQLDGYHPC